MTRVKLWLKNGGQVMVRKEQLATVWQLATMIINQNLSTTPALLCIDTYVKVISVSKVNYNYTTLCVEKLLTSSVFLFCLNILNASWFFLNLNWSFRTLHCRHSILYILFTRSIQMTCRKEREMTQGLYKFKSRKGWSILQNDLFTQNYNSTQNRSQDHIFLWLSFVAISYEF